MKLHLFSLLLGVIGGQYQFILGVNGLNIQTNCDSDKKLSLMVKYSGTGTVDIVSWKFSKMTDPTKTLNIITAICQATAGADPAFPVSRMTYACDNNTKIYTITINDFDKGTDGGTWEAAVSVSGALSEFTRKSVLCLLCLLLHIILSILGITCGCLGVIVIVILIILILKVLIKKRTGLVLILIVVVLFVLSIGFGAGVLGNDYDDCDAWVGNCAKASLGISCPGVVAVIVIGILIFVDVIKLDKKADKGKTPQETQEMTNTTL